jgi:aquaporin Z
LKVFAAELLGTFLLTFFGAGAALQSVAMGAEGLGLLGVALVNGIILSVAVTATMPTSGGHLNPAVTLAFLLTGRMRARRAPLYIVAQLAGAVLAGLLLRPFFPGEVIDAARLGMPAPGSPALGFGTVVGMEVLLSFVLAIAIWGTALDPRAPRMGGPGIGLAFAGGILIGGPISGAAMNPARVLGPALAGGFWEMHAAYWIGPIVGIVLGSFFYKLLLLEPEPARNGARPGPERN